MAGMRKKISFNKSLDFKHGRGAEDMQIFSKLVIGQLAHIGFYDAAVHEEKIQGNFQRCCQKCGNPIGANKEEVK